jgi:hypothetical protein
MATWEDNDVLRTRYPTAKAWGQASSQGQGNVTPAVPSGVPPAQGVAERESLIYSLHSKIIGILGLS